MNEPTSTEVLLCTTLPKQQMCCAMEPESCHGENGPLCRLELISFAQS